MRWRSRTSGAERTAFLQALSQFLSCGVPVDQALKDLPVGGALASRLRRSLLSGFSFADALERENEFDPVTVALVRAGEAHGALVQALNQAADVRCRRQKLRSAAVSASVYPAFVLALAGVVTAVMGGVVLPRFRQAFERLGVQLPQATRFLMSVGPAFAVALPVVILLLGTVALLARRRLLPQGVTDWWEKICDRLPFLGPWRRAAAMARSTAVLAGSLAAGVEMRTALGLAGRASGRAAVCQALSRARDRVSAGMSLSDALSGEKVIGPWAVGILKVGEQTGCLAESLQRLADLLAQEQEGRSAMAMKILEPAVILAAGAVTAFVAWGIFAPLVSAVEGLS